MSGLMQLNHVTIERGGRTLLANLGCEIRQGEITVVLGPNGAGKSSLLLALAGLIPAAGTIEIGGRPLPLFSRHALSRQIAWQGALPPTEFGLAVQQRLQLASASSAAPIELAAATMDTEDLLTRPLGELSSGERQRVELAALLLRDTPVWLLDEPTSHLDLKHQIHCIALMKAQRAEGRAIVTVLHDLQQAMAVADRLILIDGEGGVVAGAADQLFDSDGLSRLFDAPLCRQGALLIPDYMGVDDETT